MGNNFAETQTPAQRLDKIATELRNILPIPIQTQNRLLNKDVQVWQAVEALLEEKSAQYPLEIGNALRALFALKQELFPQPSRYPVAPALSDRGLTQITNADQYLQRLKAIHHGSVSLEAFLGGLSALPGMEHVVAHLQLIVKIVTEKFTKNLPDEEVILELRRVIAIPQLSDSVREFLIPMIMAKASQEAQRNKELLDQEAELYQKVLLSFRKYMQSDASFKDVNGLIGILNRDPQTKFAAEAIQNAMNVVKGLAKDGIKDVKWSALKMTMRSKNVPQEVYHKVVEMLQAETESGIFGSAKRLLRGLQEILPRPDVVSTGEQTVFSEETYNHYVVQYPSFHKGVITVGTGSSENVRLKGLRFPEHLCEIAIDARGPMITPKNTNTPLYITINDPTISQMTFNAGIILPPADRTYKIAIAPTKGQPTLYLEMNVKENGFTLKYPSV